MGCQSDQASTAPWPDAVYDERVGVRPVAAGVVGGLGAFFLVHHLVDEAGASLLRTALELPFLLLSLSLLYAGYWLLRCDVPHRRAGRVAACSVAGFLGLTAVAVWLVGGQGLPLQRSLFLAVDVGTVGASTGLLVGLDGERRSGLDGGGTRDATLAAERAEERFAFLNRLLRHHLLNGVAVVRGHAEMLAETLEEPPEEVAIIRHRSDELVGLVRNAETLGRAFTGDLHTEAIDPVGPLREAVEVVRRDRPDADVRTDFHDGRQVVASERLDVAFEALLRFAVDSAAESRVSASAAATDDAVVVSISFDGSAARPEHPPTVAEEAEGAELGLFLAETLIEGFGGTVVAGDGGDVRVWLPAAG